MNFPAFSFLSVLKKSTLVRARHRLAGFSLVELMVSCAILAVMMGLISLAIRQMAGGIKTSTAKVDAFQSARTGFESVSRTLGVATLNTYWDYFNSSRQPRSAANASTFQPATYGRQSDLHFLIYGSTFTNSLDNINSTSNRLTPAGHSVFFQAPLGYFTNTSSTNPPGSLNPCGFFVAYGNDPTKPNLTGINDRPRFRLYQWLPSSESLTVASSSGRITNSAWVTPTNGVRPLAENIIAFVIRVPSATNSTGPAMNSTTYSTTATNYNWNSLTPGTSTNHPAQMHQLPPLVNITMVAVEEAAVNRLAGTAASASDAASAMGITNFSTLFTDEAQYDADLLMLETALSGKNIPYRTFTTTVPLRGSRWSP
jgi:uncharacterized protein (TIGR02599 family)